MIDEKDLNSPTENEGFADDGADNEAFRLESLERYPDAVPFEFEDGGDDAAADSDDSTQLPAATLAAIKNDLDKSRRRKAKPDTLALSLDRLRKVLQTSSPEEAEYTIESDPLLVDPLSGKPGSGSADITITERPVITERKPIKQLEDIDPLRTDTPAAMQPKPTTARPAKKASNKKRRALPVIPIIVGAGVVVAVVGGYIAYNSITSKAVTTSDDGTSSQTTKAEQTARTTSTSGEETLPTESAESGAQAFESQPLGAAQKNGGSDSDSETMSGVAPQTKAEVAAPTDALSNSKTESATRTRSNASSVHQQHSEPHKSPSTGTMGSQGGVMRSGGHASSETHRTPHTSSHTPVPDKKNTHARQTHTVAGATHGASHSLRHSTSAASASASVPTPQAKWNATASSKHGTEPRGKHPVDNEASKAKQATTHARHSVSEVKSSKNSRNESPASRGSGSTSIATNKETSDHGTTPRSSIIPAPLINIKSRSGVTTQYSIQVFSTAYRQDAERRLQQLQLRSISGAYISEQQVRGKTIYNVRFGSFRTKEDAEATLIRYSVSGGSVCRLR